jgi:type III secretory pathway component EscS
VSWCLGSSGAMMLFVTMSLPPVTTATFRGGLVCLVTAEAGFDCSVV